MKEKAGKENTEPTGRSSEKEKTGGPFPVVAPGRMWHRDGRMEGKTEMIRNRGEIEDPRNRRRRGNKGKTKSEVEEEEKEKAKRRDITSVKCWGKEKGSNCQCLLYFYGDGCLQCRRCHRQRRVSASANVNADADVNASVNVNVNVKPNCGENRPISAKPVDEGVRTVGTVK